MSAEYRVTFCHKPTGTRRDVYLSSADAKTTKTVDIKTANRKAIAKAKDRLARSKPSLQMPYPASEYVPVSVLCVG